MNTISKRYGIWVTIFLLVFASCQSELEKMNINPNGVSPETANPNLVLPTILTAVAGASLGLGYGDPMGVMQYTQLDGHGSSYNNYDWEGDNPWSSYYDILRNTKFVQEKAYETNDELLIGVNLVMQAWTFGLLTDLYGDIPYDDALQGDKEDLKFTFVKFDDQESVYHKILDSLDKANTLLSKSKSDYENDITSVDVLCGGDPAKWRKFANSLALRFYMRLAEKDPGFAKAGIEKIVDNQSDYPLITSSDDDITMSYLGNTSGDSWPDAVIFDADSSDFRRIKMAKTFVDTLKRFQDPRIAVWAKKVAIPIKIDFNKDKSVNGDTIILATLEGVERKVRYVTLDVLTASNITINDIDTSTNYVGIPIATTAPQAYNLSPDPQQSSHNPHVSWLNDRYMQASGPLLKARVIAASEVHFIISEAKAVYGWTGADAEEEYEEAIKASFETWDIADQYDDYIQSPLVKFNNTQKQIITEKWISFWTLAQEAWFDYRRTGYPVLPPGRAAKSTKIPLRFYYPKDEQDHNKANEEAAASKLEVTPYSQDGDLDDHNSPWSKMWVLQGTGKPY